MMNISKKTSALINAIDNAVAHRPGSHDDAFKVVTKHDGIDYSIDLFKIYSYPDRGFTLITTILDSTKNNTTVKPDNEFVKSEIEKMFIKLMGDNFTKDYKVIILGANMFLIIPSYETYGTFKEGANYKERLEAFAQNGEALLDAIGNAILDKRDRDEYGIDWQYGDPFFYFKGNYEGDDEAYDEVNDDVDNEANDNFYLSIRLLHYDDACDDDDDEDLFDKDDDYSSEDYDEDSGIQLSEADAKLAKKTLINFAKNFGLKVTNIKFHRVKGDMYYEFNHTRLNFSVKDDK